MLSIGIDKRTKELSRLLGGKRKKIKKELAIAVNATAKKTKASMNKQVRKELTLKKKTIDSTLTISRKATESVPSTTVRLKKTKRISLREYKARQTKKGISYKISKTAGRAVLAGGFQGPKPGAMKASWRGHAFKRVGKARLPIVKLFGPSPWGAFAKKKMRRPTVKEMRAELKKQLDRRIRYHTLKQSGKI